MDQSTVRAIGDLAVEAQKANRIETDTPAAILRSESGGQKVVSLEQFEPGRSRYRGTFATNGLMAFAEHVVKTAEANGSQKVKTFIDPENVRATAFFNLGDFEHPGHADHKAQLTLKPTAAYAALKLATATPMNQRQLHDFLEDWRDIVVPVYGETADASRMASALAAVRSITIEQARKVNLAESDFGASRSTMESVDAKSEHTLPARFNFSAIPYEGFTQRTFVLRLGVLTGAPSEQLRLQLRVMQVEKVEEEITAEFRNLLDTQISAASDLFIGTFQP